MFSLLFFTLFALTGIEFELQKKLKLWEKCEENLRQIWTDMKEMKFQKKKFQKLGKTERKFEGKLKEIFVFLTCIISVLN